MGILVVWRNKGTVIGFQVLVDMDGVLMEVKLNIREGLRERTWMMDKGHSGRGSTASNWFTFRRINVVAPGENQLYSTYLRIYIQGL